MPQMLVGSFSRSWLLLFSAERDDHTAHARLALPWSTYVVHTSDARCVLLTYHLLSTTAISATTTTVKYCTYIRIRRMGL